MATTATAPALGIGERARPVRSFRLRRSEWLILAFLIYAPALALLLPVAHAVRGRICVVDAAVLLAYGFLVRSDTRRPRLFLGVIRDWLPLAAVILAYREMGWFALPHTSWLLESHWVVWDRLVLRGGARAAIEIFGPILPALLEIAYALVYTLAPFCVAVLYLSGSRASVDRFLFVFVLGALLCYAQFPFWPSEPPRVVFAGQDLPSYFTVFRRFNLWMLGDCGIHTSVFPSAHVAAAFSAAFGMRYAMPSARRLGAFLFSIAALIAVATVYGRYHYLADAAAGLLMALFAAALQGCCLPARAHRKRGVLPQVLTEES